MQNMICMNAINTALPMLNDIDEAHKQTSDEYI